LEIEVTAPVFMPISLLPSEVQSKFAQLATALQVPIALALAFASMADTKGNSKLESCHNKHNL
jgi:hypothetical protein